MYTSDSDGVAAIDIDMTDFSMTETRPVAFRTVVVHATDTAARIGCGVIGTASTGFASLGDYPGYAGEYNISGSVGVIDSASGITFLATLSGLEPSSSGGIHIHSGFTCDDADYVGAHFFEGLDADPWTTTYTSDASGTATVALEMSDFSLAGAFPVAGRAVVVHLSGGDPAACGLIMATSGEIVTVGGYPGYDGVTNVSRLETIRKLSVSLLLMIPSVRVCRVAGHRYTARLVERRRGHQHHGHFDRRRGERQRWHPHSLWLLVLERR